MTNYSLNTTRRWGEGPKSKNCQDTWFFLLPQTQRSPHLEPSSIGTPCNFSTLNDSAKSLEDIEVLGRYSNLINRILPDCLKLSIWNSRKDSSSVFSARSSTYSKLQGNLSTFSMQTSGILYFHAQIRSQENFFLKSSIRN